MTKGTQIPWWKINLQYSAWNFLAILWKLNHVWNVMHYFHSFSINNPYIGRLWFNKNSAAEISVWDIIKLCFIQKYFDMVAMATVSAHGMKDFSPQKWQISPKNDKFYPKKTKFTQKSQNSIDNTLGAPLFPIAIQNFRLYSTWYLIDFVSPCMPNDCHYTTAFFGEQKIWP